MIGNIVKIPVDCVNLSGCSTNAPSCPESLGPTLREFTGPQTDISRATLQPSNGGPDIPGTLEGNECSYTVPSSIVYSTRRNLRGKDKGKKGKKGKKH